MLAVRLSVLAAAAVLCSSAQLLAQAEHIFRVSATGCLGQPTDRVLTGFRVKGTKGIVTALHGVAGAKTITAERAAPALDAGKLHIVKLDFERDLALCSSPELERLPADGLELLPAGVTVGWAKLTGLKVIGYPGDIGQGFKAQRTDLTVRKCVDSEEASLDKLLYSLDAELRKSVSPRKSPALSTLVLNLQAHLLPGHSGAPILDERNRVIAVGNGGLKDGTIEHCWAIPFDDPRFDRWVSAADAEKKKEYTDLVKMDVPGLFAIPGVKAVVRKTFLDNGGDATLVLKEIRNKANPLFDAVDANNHLGMAPSGTGVRVIERVDELRTPNPVIRFRKVEILEGDLKGKAGWVSSNTIKVIEK